LIRCEMLLWLVFILTPEHYHHSCLGHSIVRCRPTRLS
jgi:hypothetical protein